MTSQYRHRRTSNPATVFPNPIEPGEITVNTANRQLAVGDAASATLGTPKPLLPIRYFDIAAQYVANDFVVNGISLYRANKATGPGAFVTADWIMMVGAVDPQYVAKVGDVMTGALSLPAANPTAGVHATNKTYVDGLVASKSSVIVSDVKPVPDPINSTLWYNTQDGQLYIRYNDGNSTAWVIAAPQPDAGMFIQRTGDTMSGPLVVVTPPTAAAHAASKAYVDAGTAVAVRYDSAQSLTPAQQGQARQNINAASFEALGAMNIAINGGAVVSQVWPVNGTSPQTAGVGYVFADMWIQSYQHLPNTAVVTGYNGNITGGNPGIQPPAGFNNCIAMYFNTAMPTPLAVGSYAYFHQKIEGTRALKLGWGTAAAQPLTYAFMLYTNDPGIGFVKISNHLGDRNFYQEFNAPINGWNFITGTISADTGGTWKKDNTASIGFNVFLCGKSTTPAAPGSWGATDAYQTTNSGDLCKTSNTTCGVTGLLLLGGTHSITQSILPLCMRPFAEELPLCQRYYEKTYNHADPPGTNNGGGAISFIFPTNNITINQNLGIVSYSQKRIAPTIILWGYSGTQGALSANTGADFAAGTGITVNAGERGASVRAGAAITTGQNVLLFHATFDARM